MFGGVGKTRSAPEKVGDDFGDRPECVAMNERREIVIEIEQPVAVSVDDIGAFAVLHIQGVRISLDGSACSPIGKNCPALAEECLRSRMRHRGGVGD